MKPNRPENFDLELCKEIDRLGLRGLSLGEIFGLVHGTLKQVEDHWNYIQAVYKWKENS